MTAVVHGTVVTVKFFRRLSKVFIRVNVPPKELEYAHIDMFTWTRARYEYLLQEKTIGGLLEMSREPTMYYLFSAIINYHGHS